MLPLADACRAAATACPQFADAAALVRVWARQQQLCQGADGLSGWLLTLLLVHLLESGHAVSGWGVPLLASALHCIDQKWGWDELRMRKDNLITHDPNHIL